MKKPLIFGHRGASAYAPENTLSAYSKAFELNSDGIELDVHLTSDCEVVCIHDSTVDRTSNGKGEVSKMTLKELRKLDFGSWFSKDFADERIPTLDETLALSANAGKLVNIEIKGKSKNIEVKTIQIIEKYNMQKKVIISSFNHDSLIKIKKLSPALKTGLLFSKGKISSPEYVKKLGASAIHPWYGDMNEKTIKPFLQNNIEVNVYTVNDVKSIQNMASIGVSSIITNVPDKAKEVLLFFS